MSKREKLNCTINSETSELNSIKPESKKFKNSIIIILLIAIFISFSFNIIIPIYLTSSNDYYHEYTFHDWITNSPSLLTLQNYIKEITTNTNQNYIPIKDRIAVFDLDGTLIGEKAPTNILHTFYRDTVLTNYTLYSDPKRQEILKKLNDSIEGKIVDKDFEISLVKDIAKIFEFYTVDDYRNLIKKYLNIEAYNFNNLKFKDMYYKPMIEIIKFLQNNFFKIYIVSSSERFFVRELIKNFINIPPEQIIATDFILIGKEENITKFDYENLYHYDYLNSHTDYLIKSDMVGEFSMKFTKVRQIAKQLGRKPILSFGNSEEDASMHNYVIDGNKYKSLAFMIVADDIEREYGIDNFNEDGSINKTNSDNMKNMWRDKSGKYGYQIISMRDDFKTIYGDNVKITKK